jgi:hypothetical protein
MVLEEKRKMKRASMVCKKLINHAYLAIYVAGERFQFWGNNWLSWEFWP